MGETLAALGSLSVIAGVVDIFYPGNLADAVWTVWPALLVSFIWGVARAWPRLVLTSFNSPRTTIKLVEGDLFDGKDHLVIGACDTFDIEPPHIAPGSIQGQFLAGEYGGNAAHLNADVDSALAGKNGIGSIPEKPGRNVRYPIGTVLTLPSRARKFFLVAYSKMDEFNSARTSPDMLWNALGELWREARKESNGGTVRIPIIGGGQSKASDFLPAEDALRFIVLSFLTASRDEGKVCDELTIVALKDQYEQIDQLEFQSFLNGLRR